MAEGMCPNCGVRTADTGVSFSEVVYSRFSSRPAGYGGWRQRSYSNLTRYGQVTLCSACATRYGRLVRWREWGRRLLNYGFAVLLVGAVLYGVLASSQSSLSSGVGQLLLAAPPVVGALVMLIGAVFSVVAAIMRRSATRFILAPLAAPVGQPGYTPPLAQRGMLSRDVGTADPDKLLHDMANASPLDQADRRAARAARARKRRLRRIGWTTLGIGVWLALLGSVFFAIWLTGMHVLTGAAGPTSYSNSLAGQPEGWAEATGCTGQDDAYHLAPYGGSGVVCFAPAGRHANVLVQVTAHLSSGATTGAYGLVFRAADTGDAYLFGINNAGQAFVAELINGTVTQLSDVWPYTSASGTTTGQASLSHVLTVEAKGSTITCSVDGVQVGSIVDSRYSVGAVGLYADPGLDVAFTDFSVKAI
jgi:hypothetical protein